MGDKRYLVVVNFSDRPAQARVRVPWTDIQGQTLRLADLLSGAVFDRKGDEMRGEGLYVELGSWGYHFLQCQLAREPRAAVAA